MDVYCIEDGGESYWYAAATPDEARVLHRKFMYFHAGMPDPTPADMAHWSVEMVPGDRALRFTDTDKGAAAGEPVEKTAAEWAAYAGKADFLATSAL